MKKHSSLLIAIIITLVMLGINYTLPIVGIDTNSTIVAYAEGEDDDAVSAFDKVKNSKGTMGDDVQNKVSGLSNDVLNVTLAVVMGVLSVTTLWTTTAFTGAGDNPQKKASLKSKLIYQVLGIAFVASYSGFISFGLKNLNLFKG